MFQMSPLVPGFSTGSGFKWGHFVHFNKCKLVSPLKSGTSGDGNKIND